MKIYNNIDGQARLVENITDSGITLRRFVD
jgi:hypothetical protein